MIARIAPLAAVVLVVAGVILAFGVMGSPQQARLLRFDTTRARNAQAIVQALSNNYAATSAALPTTLAALQPDTTFFLAVRDPQTNRLYDYRRLSAHSYKLCINFSAPTAPGAIESAVLQWAHKAPGLDCKIIDVAK